VISNELYFYNIHLNLTNNDYEIETIINIADLSSNRNTAFVENSANVSRKRASSQNNAINNNGSGYPFLLGPPAYVEVRKTKFGKDNATC